MFTLLSLNRNLSEASAIAALLIGAACLFLADSWLGLGRETGGLEHQERGELGYLRLQTAAGVSGGVFTALGFGQLSETSWSFRAFAVAAAIALATYPVLSAAYRHDLERYEQIGERHKAATVGTTERAELAKALGKARLQYGQSMIANETIRGLLALFAGISLASWAGQTRLWLGVLIGLCVMVLAAAAARAYRP
ncbi:MAG TPA: hypothetical protein VK790_13815 [Solirubrobacteraceae bacterium]|nr:hypothetical protein [Solirubrobacteraceae bacterium]